MTRPKLRLVPGPPRLMTVPPPDPKAPRLAVFRARRGAAPERVGTLVVRAVVACRGGTGRPP
jgi:hypothetical protein